MSEATPASTSDAGQQTQTVTDNQTGNGQVQTHQGSGSQAGTPTADAAPKSMLETVEAALKPTEGGTSQVQKGPTADAKTGAPTDGKGSEYDGSADLSDEEKGKLSERTQRRMAHLSNEVKARSEEIEVLKPDADIGRRVTEFAQKAGLSVDEMNQGFMVMHAIKKDPQRAHAMLAPLMEQLQKATGEVLPADLQQAVDDGSITLELAKELSRNRATAGLSQQQLKERDDRDAREAEETRHRTHVETVSNAVRQYDLTWQKTDPDYALKKDRVLELVELDIRRNGFAKSAQEGVEQVKKARDTVEKELAQLRGNGGVRPITPVTGSGSSAQGKPAPKNLSDVIDRVLAG